MKPYVEELKLLKFYLSYLPTSLPLTPDTRPSFYRFHCKFDFDESFETLEEEEAVLQELTFRFGERPIEPFVERGEGLLGVVAVLDTYLQKYPESEGLRGWIETLTTGALHTITNNGLEIPDPCASVKLAAPKDVAYKPKIILKAKILVKEESHDDGNKKQTAKRSRPKATKVDSKILANYDDPKFITDEEDEDDRRSGAQILPLLLDISRPCKFRDTAQGNVKKQVRCLGSAGCHTSWSWPRNRQRILTHAAGCNYLPADLQRRAINQLAGKAIGSSNVTPAVWESGDESDSLNLTRPLKRSRTDSELPNNQSNKMVHTLSTLDGFVAKGRKQGINDLKSTGDNNLLLFLVCNSIPPTVIDGRHFKNFAKGLNPNYCPPSSSTMVNKLVPNESASINVKNVEFLKTQRDLTITFDGGKVRQPKAFYSIHITTADRQEFCLEIDDASCLSHTANYIDELLERIAQLIGPSNISGACSDNTGNTRKCREIFCARHPHIINMPDACHHMNKPIQEICRLDTFKEVIQHVRTILAFMSKSTYAMEHFNHERQKLKISRGLQKVGETRFGTVFWAAESVRRSLPAFRSVTKNEELDINVKGLNHLFEDGYDTMRFEMELTQLIAIIGPFAKAIQCLESRNTTPSDVYLYWLAAVAQLSHLFDSNRARLDNFTIENIRAISNRRFDEIINKSDSDVYIIAFFLDPRHRGASIFKNINPLAPSIVVPTTVKFGGRSAYTADSEPWLTKRVRLGLQKMLKREYGDIYARNSNAAALDEMQARNPLLAMFHPGDALINLKNELKAFSRNDEPFNRRFRASESVRDWWVAVQKDEFAHILGALAVKIFSITPVSMVDERMASVVTNLNGAKRNAQKIQTIKDQVVIRGYHRDVSTKDKSKTSLGALVKWRDMDKTIHGTPDEALTPELALRPQVITASTSTTHKSTDGPGDATHIEDSDDDDDSDMDDGLEWVRKPAPVLSGPGIERSKFKMADHIDFSSPYLRDLLDEEPAAGGPLNTGMTNNSQSQSRTDQNKQIPKDLDWST